MDILEYIKHAFDMELNNDMLEQGLYVSGTTLQFNEKLING